MQEETNNRANEEQEVEEFDLPEVKPVKTVARISISDNLCLSCQG